MGLIDSMKSAQMPDRPQRVGMLVEATEELAQLLAESEPLIMPRRPKIIPAVGVHENIPEDVYHRQWDAVSNSRLTVLYDRTPAHLREVIDNPPPDTAATLMGRAIHSAILTPGEFTRYVAGPEKKRSNKDKEAWAQLEAEYGVGYVLRPVMLEHVIAIKRAVQEGPSGAAIMALLDGRSELCVVWVDPVTGILCKARLDHLTANIVTPEGSGAIIDVKSTEDASWEAFRVTIANYGYHRQAAMYLDGAFANGLEAAHYIWIAVEKKPPYGVGIYRADAGTLAAGKASLELLMKRYSKCVTRNEWPCYPPEVIDIGLPPWALKRIEDETRGAPV